MKNGSGMGVGAAVAIVLAVAMAFQAFAAVESWDDADVRPASDASMIRVGGYSFDCLAGEPPIWDELAAQPVESGATGLYIVHAESQIQASWMKAIEGLGAEVVTYVPNYAYEVRMTPEQAERANALPFVDWVGQYHPAYKISPDLQGSEVTITFVGDSLPKGAIEGVRAHMGVWEEGATSSGYIMHGVLAGSDALAAIAASPYVQFIAPYIENELCDEAGSQIIGGYMWYQDPDNNVATPYRGSGTHGGYANQLGYDGAGITLGIADTGLGTGATPNAGHNDFTGRVIGGMAFDAGAWGDGHGHGTHCAGLAVGDSFEGNGVTYAGFGPYYASEALGHEANLYAEKIFSDGGSWIGPTDYADILTTGYAGGARIHTNSWGSASGGAYGAADQAYDTCVRDSDTGAAGNQQLVTFVAAGNSYTSNTIGSPGNGKNVITIGATDNYMPDSMSHGNTDENGDRPDAITDFSSKGWTDDNRIKPDVSAPGRATLSTRSPNVATSNLYGFYTEDTRYEWCSGTSQACPTAAGAGIAVMDWYNTVYGSMPTPAMVKALLINSAIDIPDEDDDGNANNAYPIPNLYEGWGRVFIPTVVDPASSWLVYDAPTEITASGSNVEYTCTYVNSGLPLKFTLAYTDVNAISGAAVTLINNLDLRVTSPGGDVYHGNAFVNGLTPANTNPIAIWDTNADGWDDRNNVECVYIAPANLESGLYTVRITGFNIAGDCDNDGTNDQDFSMVISNAQDVTSYGVVNIQYPKYLREAIVQVAVMDMDLNTNGASVQTTTIPVSSVAEPAGETLLLTETGVDTGVFQGTKTISATNSAGVLWVNAADLITATYNDADYGGTGPMVLTDTAIVDGTPPGAPGGLTVEWYGLVQQEFFSEDFEGDGSPTFAELGWTTGGASNDWQVGTPAGLGTPADPTGAYGGAFSIGNDLTGLGTYPGEYEDGIVAESNYVYSDAMVCTGYTDVQLEFARYLGVESPTYDHSNVEASTSTSGPWTTVWTNAATISDTAWSVVTYDISAIADNQPAVYVRFELGQTDGSVTYCGWNVDNLALLGMTSGTMHNTVNWTLSADDGAGADDVDHYNVYRSNQQTGPWDATTLIDTVPAGTATYVDPDRGEFDGVNWWYVIRAMDNIGNLDMNTNAVPEVPLINVAPSAPNNPTPANGAVAVPVNTILSVRAADPNGDPLTVSFYNAAGPTLIGTNNNVPSGTYTTMPWNGLLASTTYSWYATAYDGEFTTPSSTWSFTTTDLTPPGPVTGLTVQWTGTTSGTALDEDFSAGIPVSWTVVDGGSGGAGAATWTTANPGGRAGTAPITTPFAIVDSDNAGTTATQDEQLVTPAMDLSSATSATLEFDHYFYRYSDEVVDVDVRSTNTGGAWTNVYTRTGTSSPNPEHQTIDISTHAAGASDAQVRFHYSNGAYDWYWMVDNVQVSYTGGGTTTDNLLDWTLSADDGAGVDDVSNYNIYRAATSAGPWDSGALVTSIAAGVSTYTDVGRGEFDGTNWWYVVRAEDVWGNEEMNTVAVPEIASAAVWFNITVAAGWNLVSVPILGPTTMPGALLDKTGGVVWTRAMWYDLSTPADPWKQYNSAWTSSLNDLTAVGNTVGVWLFVTTLGDGQICVGGTGYSTPVSTGIMLRNGWNLVSFPSNDATYTAGNLKIDMPTVTLIEQYDGAQTYRTSVMADATAFVSGRAYWVYNNGVDTTWNKAW